MTATAQCMTADIIQLRLWKSKYLLPDARNDSKRLIERSAVCFGGIKKTFRTAPKFMSDRIFRRCVVIQKSFYSSDTKDQQKAGVIAIHVAKLFSVFIENPELYYGFFDPVVYKAHDAPDIILSADGCLLVAALYHCSPWELFGPRKFEFYTHWSSKLYRSLYENKSKSIAVRYLSEEEHARKAVGAITNLFEHPSKI